ncbi:gluconate 2-dehydrogenase subunit 3 family protein [Mesorhizobium sp. PAMC28654]|uniref:gluconate 2-dehydrogenase subunit 3 family protein n=1 Tax=Mesorhizobium sp. PAMC28654 TaxID=2880934 RepID=UPI001D0B0BB7|nr:gluconate 2-dehydrogenase subunit 3 family protein [Mesorhizobium sp. PAMC28654]UDL91388.1 gluconate 2-dehydrogenase subunit 3 family protein [Mesorhizobium sp. PAMC28654]
MNKQEQPGTSRRQFLLSTTAVILLATAGKAGAVIIKGAAPWTPFDYSPPQTLEPGGWHFFTPQEAAAVEAIVERLIPADELSVSGKDAGCAEFIDRQLAGSFGTFERLYMQGPFQAGVPEQGDQSSLVPQQRYRVGLAGLESYCQDIFKQSFADLSADQRDKVLTGLQNGDITLKGIDAKLFFATILTNTMEGFFADPIYGGNRDMVSWKMLGFPGARYDYRDYVEMHNQKIDLPPLSIAGRPDWKAKG